MVARACGTRMYVHMGEESAKLRSDCANPVRGLAMVLEVLLRLRLQSLLLLTVVVTGVEGIVVVEGRGVALNGKGLRVRESTGWWCFDCRLLL